MFTMNMLMCLVLLNFFKYSSVGAINFDENSVESDLPNFKIIISDVKLETLETLCKINPLIETIEGDIVDCNKLANVRSKRDVDEMVEGSGSETDTFNENQNVKEEEVVTTTVAISFTDTSINENKDAQSETNNEGSDTPQTNEQNPDGIHNTKNEDTSTETSPKDSATETQLLPDEVDSKIKESAGNATAEPTVQQIPPHDEENKSTEKAENVPSSFTEVAIPVTDPPKKEPPILPLPKQNVIKEYSSTELPKAPLVKDDDASSRAISQGNSSSETKSALTGVNVFIIFIVTVAVAGLAAFGYKKYKQRQVRYCVVSAEDGGREMKEIKKNQAPEYISMQFSDPSSLHKDDIVYYEEEKQGKANSLTKLNEESSVVQIEKNKDDDVKLEEITEPLLKEGAIKLNDEPSTFENENINQSYETFRGEGKDSNKESDEFKNEVKNIQDSEDVKTGETSGK